MISDEAVPSYFVDRRQWLKGTTIVLASGILSSRWLRAVGSTAASPAELGALLPEAAVPVAQSGRRYIHGFEAYSGF